jgi:hypothetical protein
MREPAGAAGQRVACVASPSFFFNIVPTRMPDRMAASVAFSMAFIATACAAARRDGARHGRESM